MKTCKVCNETKDDNVFKYNICKTCVYLKETRKNTAELPNSYIKKRLMDSYRKNNPLFERSMITDIMIVEHRNLMLQKRKAAIENKRYCYGCKTIKEHSDFLSKKGSCKPCKRLQASTWKKNNPKKVANNGRVLQGKHRQNLTDAYIRGLFRKTINQNTLITITSLDIPQELVELKRKELILKRQIDDKSKTNNSSSEEESSKSSC